MTGAKAGLVREEPCARPEDVAERLMCDAIYVVHELSRNQVPIPEGKTLDPADIDTIIRITGTVSPQNPLSNEDFRALGGALARILQPLTPITVQSLYDTDPNIKRRNPIRIRTYEANLLSWTLGLWTLGFSLLAISGEVWERFYGPPLEQTEGWTHLFGLILSSLAPFTYGAMGACVYLLRSLHRHIVERNFDRRRRPEYVNRVVLGGVSGGAMALLVNEITTDSGETVQLSAAALGFLAGYNTDLLFSAIERITNAILPKVGIESVRRATPRREPESPPLPTLEALLDRYAEAKTDEEKAMIKDLIDRVKPPAPPPALAQAAIAAGS